MATLGRICDPIYQNKGLGNVLTFDWDIPKIPPCQECFCAIFTSPRFPFLNASWCCQIYPNGRTHSSGNSWGEVSVSLGRAHCLVQSIYNTTITMSIYSGSTCLSTKVTNAKFDKDVRDDLQPVNALFPSVLKSSKLEDEEIQKNGLKIVFQLDVQYSQIVDVAQDIGPKESVSRVTDTYFPKILSLNMKDIFFNQKYCDITIKVGEKLFPAHKIILRARSPVFAAMFEHEMTENLNAELNITDADSDVFHDILLYIYSGEIQTMSSDNVCEYYKIADKYDLEELKNICVHFIECNISEIHVYDFLLLADTHNDMELKQVVEDFIFYNVKNVLQNEKWKNFKSENHILSMEILEMLIWKKY